MKKFDGTHCPSGHEAAIYRVQGKHGGHCKACHAERRQRVRELRPAPPTLEERFWAKVDKAPGLGRDGECWLWIASGVPRGYGTLSINGKKAYAHRYSYALAHGAIGEGLEVRHSCDTPACVNPAHLSQGTHTDNVQDMISRGRGYSQKKTHCKQGHEFTPENTYKWKGNPRRVCRICASKHY